MEHEAPGERPGTELEARRETLPAELVAAPNRAGSMVAEFVNSIVEEAQARAMDMIRAAAEGDDAGQRDALESADRMRARVDVIAEELEAAVGQLRQESQRLAALRSQTTAAALTGGVAEADTEERQALAQVRAGLESGPAVDTEQPQAEEPDDEGPHDVEIVQGLEEDAEAEDEDFSEVAVEGEAEEELGDQFAAEAAPSVMAPEPEGPAPEAEEPAASADEAWEAAEAEEQAEGPAMEVEPAAAAEPAVEAEAEPAVEAEAEPAVEAEGPAVEAEAEPAVEAEGPAVEAEGPAVEAEGPAAGVPSAPEPEPLTEEEELARDQERFARMDDTDLAHAYSRALDQMDLQPAESEKGARLLRYAGSALGEALTRPSFADIGQGPPALETVPRMGRRRRQRAEAINTLRRACAQAIDEMSAEGAVSSP